MVLANLSWRNRALFVDKNEIEIRSKKGQSRQSQEFWPLHKLFLLSLILQVCYECRQIFSKHPKNISQISWQNNTRHPICQNLIPSENVIRNIVAMWWQIITLVSFLLASKIQNWESIETRKSFSTNLSLYIGIKPQNTIQEQRHKAIWHLLVLVEVWLGSNSENMRPDQENNHIWTQWNTPI